jgi:hypothetical protein
MIKCIVIDSAKREVYEAEISGSNHRDIYPLLGEGVSTFACPVQFNESDTLFVDDEGLYNTFEGGYIMTDWSYPICGNGVVIGSDTNGNSAPVQISLDEVRKQVRWVSKAVCEQWRDHVLGTGAGFRMYEI